MTDLPPRPSQLGPDATVEDMVRSARAHGIELPYNVMLAEDIENDPDMVPVIFRGRDGESVHHYRHGEHRREIELIEGDWDSGAWRVIYRRVPDRFQIVYQEVFRGRMPEPDPALAEPLLAAMDRIHQEWVTNDGLSELTRRRLRRLPPR